jgi:hypothetical protein
MYASLKAGSCYHHIFVAIFSLKYVENCFEGNFHEKEMRRAHLKLMFHLISSFFLCLILVVWKFNIEKRRKTEKCFEVEGKRAVGEL